MIMTDSFTITGAITATKEATDKLLGSKDEKRTLIGVRINPQASMADEDDYIIIFVNSTPLNKGSGVYRMNINDYTHIIETNVPLVSGDEVVVKNTSGATARDVIGEYIYEVE